MSLGAAVNEKVNPQTGSTWQDGDTLLCECGTIVTVGKGGYGNLRRHQAHKQHKQAMATKGSKKITDLFSKKTRLPEKPAPARLQNVPTADDLGVQRPGPSQPSVREPAKEARPSDGYGADPPDKTYEALTAVIPTDNILTGADTHTCTWLIDFETIVSSLPTSIPECLEDDMSALFGEGPDLSAGAELESRLDDFLDLWISLDESQDQLLPLIRRGRSGLQSVCNWLRRAVTTCGISEACKSRVGERIARFSDIVKKSLPKPVVAPSLGHFSNPIVLDELASDSASSHATQPLPVDQIAQRSDSHDMVPPMLRSASPSPPMVGLPDVELSSSLSRSVDFSPKCLGYELVFPPGISCYDAYPLPAHVNARLPWELHFTRSGKLILRSYDCDFIGRPAACRACSALPQDPVLFGMIDRMEKGAKEHTNFHWLGAAQIRERLERVLNELNTLKLQGLNTGRLLAIRTQHLDQHKRFMQLVAQGDIPRLSTAVKVALNNGFGVNGILDVLARATAGLYRPTSYDEKDYRLVFVLCKYGGASSANIAHRALGLPHSRTALRHAQILPIPISTGYPSAADTAKTIAAVFPSPVSSRTIGSVLMFDEVHCEQRPRYSAQDNTMVGFCRQHSSRFSLSFNSLDDAKALFSGLDKDLVHLACEATVAAIGPLTEGTREHTARPIHISGSCKREDGVQHSKLIDSILTGCRDSAVHHGTRVYCIASDGESRRGSALALLTLKRLLDETSPIYPLLSPLPLLNLACGDDDVTSDKDYKHIFKRLRGLLLRESGINVFGVYITREIVERHLVACGLSSDSAKSLLDPNDLQNVVLAVSLLAKVMQLPPLPASDDPLLARTRHALRFLGHLFGALVRPYTTTTYSLRDQLNSLSAAGHLLFALYTFGRGAVMPVQLYVDIMLMIKNVFFCVAKAKIDDPDGKFYIILLGTDRLEVVFGKMRCMIGNDCNADVLQLRERLTGASECAYILATHPEWDDAPRRLRLPSLDESGEVLLNRDIDHLNPHSWLGDVTVQSVSLLTAWTIGRQRATDLLASYGSFDFADFEGQPDVDFLRPFGKYAMRDGLSEGEDEEPEEVSTAQTTTPSLSSAATDSAGDLDPDLDDVASAELAESEGKLPWVFIDGKKVYKATIMRLFNTPGFHTSPDSADRLQRVRTYKRFPSNFSTTSQLLQSSDPGYLQVNDPAVTALRCLDVVFGALVQVSSIRVDGCPQLSLSAAQAAAHTTRVRCQILRLIPRTADPDDSLDVCDWETDCSPVGDLIEINGQMLECIDPVAATSPEQPFLYRLATADLIAITGLLHERLKQSDTISLPSVKRSPSFPYLYNELACFACQEEGQQPLGLLKNGCELCGATLPPFASSQKMLAHMSAHILCDPTFKGARDACGFCLQTNGVCKWYLTNSQTHPAIALRDSTCVKKPSQIRYKAAARLTKSSPSTNVPVRCPLCKPRDPAVWRFNLQHHMETAHPDCNMAEYKELWYIGGAERLALKELWAKIKSTVRRPRAKTQAQKIPISDAHTSRLLMRSMTPARSDVNDSGHISVDSTSTDEETSSSPGTIEDYSFLDSRSGDEEENLAVSEGGQAPHEMVAQAASTSVSASETSGINDAMLLSDHDVPTELPAPLSNVQATVSATSAPVGRMVTRKRNTRVALNTCICTDGPLIVSGQQPSPTEDMIECNHGGCTTRFYHRRCVGLEAGEQVDRWVCATCLDGSENGDETYGRQKKRRRLGKP